MPHGSRFDQPEWTEWREVVKIFVWSLLADPPQQRRIPRFKTIHNRYRSMRVLIAWMADHGFHTFTDLDQDAQQRFISDMAKRKGRNGNQISPGTLNQYNDTLHLLYLQGLTYPQLSIDEPTTDITVSHKNPRYKIPYTPDEIAIPLIQGAIRLVGTPAGDVITLQTRAQAAYDATLQEGKGQWSAYHATRRAVADFTFATLPSEDGPWYPHPITSTGQIRYLVGRIYDACFVLISYLVGMRVSEILGLEVGCLERQWSIDRTVEFLLIKGRIYKTAPTATGTPHRWIAPEIVERVIDVLESLSAPLRTRTGRPHLWLTTRAAGMYGPHARIDIINGDQMNRRLNNKFASFINLPSYEGKRWHLTTHQGRKTFARFVAKKDRRNLHALKSHFGHRSIVMTDQGYVPSDYEISELIGEAAQEEEALAYAEILTAEHLAGAAGAKISAQSRFRGKLIEDVIEYARARLTDPNFRLVVCEYGYCLYNQRLSACAGDDQGPNHALRTQSTCVGCENLVLTPDHLLIWKERRDRYINLLQYDEFHSNQHNHFKEKIAECDKVIAPLRSSQPPEQYPNGG